MQASNFILRSWNEQEKLFFVHLETIRKKVGKKPVHDIRVVVKKLRSYLQLAHALTGKDHRPIFEPVKTFFRLSGKYRDPEMNLALLKKQEKKEGITIPSFEKALRSLITTTREWTKKAAAVIVQKDLTGLGAWLYSSLQAYSDAALMELTQKLCATKMEEVKELDSELDKNAHEVRKLLKLTYYWLSACPPPAFITKKEMKSLDKCLECLGNWHDHFVLGNKIKDFRKANLVKNTEEYMSARKMEQVINDTRDGFLEEARKRVEGLMKSYSF